MSRLRTWLGSDTDGVAFVAPVSDTHGYRLAPAVRCDWHHFQRLARQGLQRGNDGITQLEQALALVRGRPFEAVPLGRYRWTDLLAYEMVDRISDVAHTAATHHLANGDLAAARAAIQRGRAADPTSELLLRDLARIEHRAGDRQALQAIHDHVQYIAEDLEVDPQPETTQLLTSLLSRDTETAIPRQYPRDQHAHA
jgi:DNA-binding SARP family transcriptional activator